jgi:hypothetical protein
MAVFNCAFIILSSHLITLSVSCAVTVFLSALWLISTVCIYIVPLALELSRSNVFNPSKFYIMPFCFRCSLGLLAKVKILVVISQNPATMILWCRMKTDVLFNINCGCLFFGVDCPVQSCNKSASIGCQLGTFWKLNVWSILTMCVPLWCCCHGIIVGCHDIDVQQWCLFPYLLLPVSAAVLSWFHFFWQRC